MYSSIWMIHSWFIFLKNAAKYYTRVYYSIGACFMTLSEAMSFINVVPVNLYRFNNLRILEMVREDEIFMIQWQVTNVIDKLSTAIQDWPTWWAGQWDYTLN